MKGKRAPSDELHLVVIDYDTNVRGPSHLERGLERTYIADRYRLDLEKLLKGAYELDLS